MPKSISFPLFSTKVERDTIAKLLTNNSLEFLPPRTNLFKSGDSYSKNGVITSQDDYVQPVWSQ